MQIKVGDSLVVARTFGEKDSPIWTATVSKVGRKWITLGEWPHDFRVSKDTLEGELVRCFFSEDDRRQKIDDERRERRANDTWSWFRSKVPYGLPAGVTAETIIEAARILGIKKDAEE